MKQRAAFSVLILAGLCACGILAAGEEVDSKELSRLVEILDVDPGESFADVGAGDGRYSVALARTVGEGGRIYATEVDPDDLKKIEERVGREKLGNVEVVSGTQEATGLSEACCEGILLRRVYHHFQNPAAMQASMRRALKDGGLLLVIDFGTRRSWDRPEGVPASRDGHGIDKDLLVSEMELAGFGLLRDLAWEDGDYALLFRAIAVPD
jgi:ubiquinone/menaquinone biosynthesis C-methylase UbiE